MAFVNIFHSTVRGLRFKAGDGKFNSGISKRLQIVKENHPDIENVEVNEDTLDNLEIGITKPNKRCSLVSHNIILFLFLPLTTV